MKSVLISLIRSEICGAELDNEIKNACLGEESMGKLLAMSSYHDVANIVAAGLAEAGLLDGTAAAKELKNRLLSSLCRYEHLRYTLSEVSHILGEGGIVHIPLKGSVVREYYPKPWMRTSCDIDVLIHKENSEKALSVLVANGYQKHDDITEHDYGLTSPSGVRLELHYNLAQDGALPDADIVLSEVWDTAYPSLDGSCVMSMSNEMFMLYHLAHMAKHVTFGGCGIRPFIDLWLLEEKMAFDRAELSTLLQRAGLHKFYEGALALAGVWFGGMEHTALTENFETFVLTGGVYGARDNHAAVKAAKGKGRLATFFSLAFLPRGKLEIIYPKLKGRPILTPFYQVKRWFGIFSKRRRKRIADITSARNRVTEDVSNSTELLLLGLGLK